MLYFALIVEVVSSPNPPPHQMTAIGDALTSDDAKVLTALKAKQGAILTHSAQFTSEVVVQASLGTVALNVSVTQVVPTVVVSSELKLEPTRAGTMIAELQVTNPSDYPLRISAYIDNTHALDAIMSEADPSIPARPPQSSPSFLSSMLSSPPVPLTFADGSERLPASVLPANSRVRFATLTLPSVVAPGACHSVYLHNNLTFLERVEVCTAAQQPLKFYPISAHSLERDMKMSTAVPRTTHFIEGLVMHLPMHLAARASIMDMTPGLDSFVDDVSVISLQADPPADSASASTVTLHTISEAAAMVSIGPAQASVERLIGVQNTGTRAVSVTAAHVIGPFRASDQFLVRAQKNFPVTVTAGGSIIVRVTW